MKTVLLVVAATFTGHAKFTAETAKGLGPTIKSSGCQVTGDTTTGVFTVQLDTCKDEVFSMRDRHTKEKYLETAKFPTATLKLSPLPASTSGSFDWQGTLELKGRSAPVAGKASLAGDKLSATFQVNVDSYPEVGAPAWQGVAMDKQVQVTVEGVVK